MTTARRSSVLLALVLVVACSPATIRSALELRMPLPPTLKGESVEILEIESSRSARRELLHVGETRMTGFARKGWDVSRSDGIVHAETEYSFRTTEGPDGWRSACTVVREHNYYDDDADSEDRLDEWIECELARDAGAETWNLALVTTIRPSMSGGGIVSEGELTDGEMILDVTSRHDVDGLRIRPLVATGYLFAEANEWIAAAETFARKIHIKRDVEERERRAILAASTALLLRRSLGTVDEE